MRDFIATFLVVTVMGAIVWFAASEIMRYLTIAGDWMRSR